MTQWHDDGRPAEWVTEVEPEFDASERESWEALAEYRSAICPRCGNFTAVCSQPGGATGDGYAIRQTVCYATAVLDSTQRRVRKKFENESPDLQGMLTTDGVSVGVSLVPDNSEDVLGLADLVAQQAPGEQH